LASVRAAVSPLARSRSTAAASALGDVFAFALVGVVGEHEVADQDRQRAREHERHELGAYGR